MAALKVGVIGVGRMGRSHAQVYAQLEGVDLIGVADLDTARTNKVAAALKTNAYPDYLSLLENPELDAVSICTPDDSHTGPALAAARLGKHILIEKPLATTLIDCDQIIDACKRKSIILMVGHILRFDPRYIQVRDAVLKGDLGDVIHILAQRNDMASSAVYYKPRTTLPLYLGVHDLDIIMWILGNRPRSVYAISSDLLSPKQVGGDSIIALMRFPDEVISSLGISWTTPINMPAPRARLEIIGTRGMADINIFNQGVSLCTSNGFIHPDITYRPLVYGCLTGILVEEISHFISTVRRGAQPLATGWDGRAAVEVALAVERSIIEGHEIALD